MWPTISLFIVFFHFTSGLNILCFFPAPSFSHQIVFQPLYRSLSLRGHNVTVITPTPLREPLLSNLTIIDVSDSSDYIKQFDVNQMISSKGGEWKILNNLDILCSGTVESEIQQLSSLIKDRSNHFDLIIVQQSVLFSLAFGVSSLFKVPVVGISSLSLFLHAHDTLGNPTHPIVSPDMLLAISNPTFFDKVNSLLYNFWYRMFYYWYVLPKTDKIARKYFGDDMPYLGDLERNVSLILVNVNPIIHGIRPNVPNIIEINQMHITDKKPLPKDLEEYLDSSSQGVVYFSLGSNVKSANLSGELRTKIIGALSELPYNVLWKWETDYLESKPENVITRKWLPQQDVLRHPNIKVFVTQGGLQSIEEAISYEVPMVGIPFITDQPFNMLKIVEQGLGLSLDYTSFTKDDLKNAIMEVATNQKYKEEIQKARSILVDQPMKGVDKAVWWIEYVIRHKGAKHLRSPAADMSYFEYFMVDVVLFLMACTVASCWILYKIILMLIYLIYVLKKDHLKVKVN